MTEDGLFDGEEYESEDEQGFEPDPSVVAFLDQEGAKFAEMEDEFSRSFGFVHKCHCAEDYGSGRVVEVTECFADMVNDALQTCQGLVQENEMLRSMLTQIFQTMEKNDNSGSSVPDPDETPEL